MKLGYHHVTANGMMTREIYITKIYLEYGTTHTDNPRYLYDHSSTVEYLGYATLNQQYRYNPPLHTQSRRVVTKQNLKTYRESYNMDSYQVSQRTTQLNIVQCYKRHPFYLMTHDIHD